MAAARDTSSLYGATILMWHCLLHIHDMIQPSTTGRSAVQLAALHYQLSSSHANWQLTWHLLRCCCCQVLAGLTKGLQGMTVSGERRYNGHSPEEFHLERTTAFVAQQDCHIPTLTVDETLSFSETCQVGLVPACLQGCSPGAAVALHCNHSA